MLKLSRNGRYISSDCRWGNVEGCIECRGRKPQPNSILAGTVSQAFLGKQPWIKVARKKII